jgi:hypothetical protein
MKKILFCIILFLGFILNLSAQDRNPVVKLSPEYKLKRNKILKGHLYSNSSGHYIYFQESKSMMGMSMFNTKSTYILEKYDRRFKQVFSKKFKSEKKNTYGLDIKYFKGKFAWFMYAKDKRNDQLKFYMVPIDLDGKAKKAKTIAKFKYERKKDFPKISWHVSPDTTKILFVASNDKDSKKENYEAYVSVLDNNFNLLWEKKIKIPVTEKRIKTFDYEVTESGDVYFMGKVYESNKQKESKRSKRGRMKKRAYAMNLYKVSADQDEYEKSNIKINDGFVKGIGIDVDDANNVACVGFFGDTKNGPIQGAFYMKLSGVTGEAEFAKKRRFTPRELLRFGRKNTSKDKKSKDTGLDDEFVFKDIIIKDNGEIMATAEENYVRVSTSTDSRGNTSTTYHYTSNSIVVINIAVDGEVENVVIIPKKQTFQTPIYGYHATLKTPDQVYFLYNDDNDNFRKNITDPDKYKKVSRIKHCIAVLTYINEDGSLTKKQLFNKKEADSVLMPSRSSQIGDNELFFFNIKAKLIAKNGFRFGIISMEE